MLEGNYYRRGLDGKFHCVRVSLQLFLAQVDFQIEAPKSGDFYLGFRGGEIVGFFIRNNLPVSEVQAYVADTYGIVIEV